MDTILLNLMQMTDKELLIGPKKPRNTVQPTTDDLILLWPTGLFLGLFGPATISHKQHLEIGYYSL